MRRKKQEENIYFSKRDLSSGQPAQNILKVIRNLRFVVSRLQGQYVRCAVFASVCAGVRTSNVICILELALDSFSTVHHERAQRQVSYFQEIRMHLLLAF